MSSKSAKDKPLFVSYEHIRRAEREFHKLKSSVNGLLSDKPYSIEARNHSTGTYIVSRQQLDIPEDLGRDAAGIIERLRSALDAAIFKFVQENGHGTSGVGFPFGGKDMNTGKPNVFPSERMTGKYGIKKKLTPEQWGFIEAQRPYPGGNDLLWGINEIANALKHRAVLVKVVPELGSGLQIGPGMPGFAGNTGTIVYRPNDRDFILRDKERETVLLFSDHAGFNQTINLDVTTSVTFSDIPPVSGKNLLSTINQKIRMTKTIVGGLRPLI